MKMTCPSTFKALLLSGLLLSGRLFAGNGAPNGTHYNLNILGKEKCAGDDLKGSNRHTIEVLLHFSDVTANGQLLADLDKRNKIFLKEGDFQVLDGNACDGDGAVFQLPANPFVCPVEDPECLNSDPTFQNYTVWLRELGKPGGTAEMRTCAAGAGLDLVLGTADDEIVCSSENVVLVRKTGKSSFREVTKELTTLVIDIDGDGDLERVGIFDDRLVSFFWDFDNNGLRLVQLRFYPLPD
jgi:hypothetical protein